MPNALHDVALGERPADLVVANGRAFVPERETFENADVLVCGDRIAALSPDGDDSVGPETTVVDAEGGVVLPGFVDAHTHLDTFQAFEQSYVHALTGGTTTVVSETSRFGTRLGASGIGAFLDATAALPVRVFATLPPSLFDDDVAGVRPPDVDRDAVAALASDDRVVGVGEVFWNRVVGADADAPLATLLDAVRDAGGVVWGHGAGCHDGDLSAFATVVDNDHEILSAADVPERVRRGVTPIGRSGSIRDDLDHFVAGAEAVPTGEPCLCSDGMWPVDLLEEGYMDRVVRRAIEAGLDPTAAFRMATLNPARHLGLDGLGSLSPGSYADVVVLSDPERVTVETVVASGTVVVRDGEPLTSYRPHEYSEACYETVHVDVGPERFRVPAAGGETVRAIDYAEGLVSAETRLAPGVEGGAFVAAPDRDVAKAALLSTRPEGDDPGFTGFVAGLGLRAGAVATSDTWGHAGVLVVGVDEGAMARAATRVAELGGGWVVAREAASVAELPTPVAGVCSDAPVETTRERFERVEAALRDAGVTVDRPLLAVGTLAAVGMPWLKLGVDGYVDVVENETLGLAIEGANV